MFRVDGPASRVIALDGDGLRDRELVVDSDDFSIRQDDVRRASRANAWGGGRLPLRVHLVHRRTGTANTRQQRGRGEGAPDLRMHGVLLKSRYPGKQRARV